MFKFLMLLILSGLLAGCGMFGKDGTFRDREDDYLKARIYEPLEVPEGLSDESINDLYQVPHIDENQQVPDEFDVPRPLPLVSGEFENMVKIQSLGEERWILVRLLPGQVWPRMKDYLVGQRIGLEVEDGSQGLMETPWVRRPEDPYKEKYRFTIRQGVQRNTSEVHIVQAQRLLEDEAAFEWPTQSDSLQREGEMMEAFARFLASSADVNASVSLVAQGIDTSRRMYIVTGEDAHISVNLSFDRAWASVAYALKKGAFILNDEDRSAGTYYVTFNDDAEAEEDGAWDKFIGVFSSGDEEVEAHGGDYQYEIRVQPAEQEGWMNITVSKPGGIAEDEAEMILSHIKGYLT